MTDSVVGAIVISLNGRDKDNEYVILRQQAEYVYYADGRTRSVESPKKKKIKHVKVVASSGLCELDKVTNRQLRNALAEYKKSGKEE